MLHVVTSTTDPLLQLVLQDPVRPHIPLCDRVGTNSRVLVLMDDMSQVQSVLCVSFSDQVVTEEGELFVFTGSKPTVVMLYTIWSVRKGGGVTMIPAAKQWVKAAVPSVQRMVTLSPPTEMARRFHLKNGARLLQTNMNTVNFEYDMH